MTQNEKEFLAEVQDLGSNYNFYMVDNNIRHLWGVLAKKDGVDYAIELIFPPDYPLASPEIQIEQNIANLFDENELSLHTLENWNEKSRAVDIVKEFKSMVREIRYKKRCPTGS